jgi:hypothetical protein
MAWFFPRVEIQKAPGGRFSILVVACVVFRPGVAFYEVIEDKDGYFSDGAVNKIPRPSGSRSGGDEKGIQPGENGYVAQRNEGGHALAP